MRAAASWVSSWENTVVATTTTSCQTRSATPGLVVIVRSAAVPYRNPTPALLRRWWPLAPGAHIGAFFIGGALRLPVTAVFVLTMAGATLAGLFGAAAAAPLARLVIDARDIIREHRAESAAKVAVPSGVGEGAGAAGPPRD